MDTTPSGLISYYNEATPFTIQTKSLILSSVFVGHRWGSELIESRSMSIMSTSLRSKVRRRRRRQ